MKNLLELRDEIDVIDKQIVALYQQRMQIAAEVAEYKIETGKKVFDKDREMEKLATLSALGDSAFNRHGIRELFEQIMSISRKRQYQLMTEHGIYEKPDFEELDTLDYKNARIVFQGTEGAYTQLALKQYFGEDAGNSYHVETWRDAMEAIAAGTRTMRCCRLRILLPGLSPRIMISWWSTVTASWASRLSRLNMHCSACRERSFPISRMYTRIRRH